MPSAARRGWMLTHPEHQAVVADEIEFLRRHLL
jgi:hypothetical protein